MNYEFKFKLQIGKAPSWLIAEVRPASDVPKLLKDNLDEIEMPDTPKIRTVLKASRTPRITNIHCCLCLRA